MDDPYDPTDDLISYFARSRRSCTVRAGHHQMRIMERLGITAEMDAGEAERLVRKAVERAREGSGGDPRVFAFSLERRIPHQEIPLSFLGQCHERMPNPDRALEIAPGVRIALMGTGDILLPDGDVCRGARIAVWADEGAGKDGN